MRIRTKRPFVLGGVFFGRHEERHPRTAEDDVLLADGAMGTLLVSRGAAPERPPLAPLRLPARARQGDPRRLRRGRRADPDDEHLGREPRQARRSSTGPTPSRRSTASPSGSRRRPPTASTSSSRARSGRSASSSSPTGRSRRRRSARSSPSRSGSSSRRRSTFRLFETFSSKLEAIEAIRAARDLSTEIPILASMTFLADGKTTLRRPRSSRRCRRSQEAGADIVGLNCTIGPQETLEVFQTVVSRRRRPGRRAAERRLPLERLGTDGLPRHARLLPRGGARLRQGGRRRSSAAAAARRRSTSPRWRARSSGRGASSSSASPARSSRAPGGPRGRVARDVRPEAEARRPERVRRHRRDRAAEGDRRLRRRRRRAAPEGATASTPSTSPTTRWRASGCPPSPSRT